MTEESVETLHHLGKLDRVVGVSSYVKRPKQALNIEKVSLFTSSNYKKINALAPDLILGHSDIQKEIARDLIEQGHDVWVANHRSLNGILDYIYRLSLLVDAKDEGEKLIFKLESKMGEARIFAENLPLKPKVYFEEWDDPQISAIGWVSELIELCGGRPLFFEKSMEIFAKDRIVDPLTVAKKNPDLIIGCWCGKRVRIESIKARPELAKVSAVVNNQVCEVPPEIFLQPGPAPFLDGIDILMKLFSNWSNQRSEK